MLLVPTLILQLFFICRYKSTLLHRQFLYTTIVVILLGIIYTLYPSSLNVGCPFLYLFVHSLNRYILYLDMIQITTIHLLLLYKLCKHIETRTMQRLQTLRCNIRPRLWHEVMIVCIQLGLPLPLLIDDIVVITKTHFESVHIMIEEFDYILLPLVGVNILLGLICIVLLVLWFFMLIKRKLLKSKAKFVCTQISHILIVLVVLLIQNTAYLWYTDKLNGPLEFSVIRTVFPVSFGVYILMSLQNLLLYKLCKHIETRIMQRLLCCNIRPRLHVIIVYEFYSIPDIALV